MEHAHRAYDLFALICFVHKEEQRLLDSGFYDEQAAEPWALKWSMPHGWDFMHGDKWDRFHAAMIKHPALRELEWNTRDHWEANPFV